MTRRIRQLVEEKLSAEMQAPKDLHKTPQDPQTERSQLNQSLRGGKPLVEGTSPEADGISSVADDVFART